MAALWHIAKAICIAGAIISLLIDIGVEISIMTSIFIGLSIGALTPVKKDHK